MSETNNSNEVVVSIKNLQKAFGDNVVLRDIDLDVHKGEVVVVLGPSGSGKSTMLRCINRLEHPTSGSIVVEVVYNWPGMGRLLVDAVEMRDYPVIQTAVLLFSLEFILINLVVDVLYAVINPTIHYK